MKQRKPPTPQPVKKQPPAIEPQPVAAPKPGGSFLHSAGDVAEHARRLTGLPPKGKRRG